MTEVKNHNFDKLTVITGKTGVGKTKRTIYNAIKKSVEEGKKILHITFDESAGVIHNSYLTAYMYYTKKIGISSATITKGDYTPKVKKAIEDNYMEIRNKCVIVVTYLADGGESLTKELRGEVSEDYYDLIIIDTPPLFKSDTSLEEETSNLLGYISKFLKGKHGNEVWWVTQAVSMPKEVLEEATVIELHADEDLKQHGEMVVEVNKGINRPTELFVEKVNLGVGYFEPARSNNGDAVKPPSISEDFNVED